MHPWGAAQLAAFLDWSAGHSQHHAARTLLAISGMRCGEALALRWRGVDLDAGTVSVRRSAGVVRAKGEGANIFSDPEGRHLHAERFIRTFHAGLARARKALGPDKLPVIRLHDLRPTHATLLLFKGIPVNTGPRWTPVAIPQSSARGSQRHKPGS